MKFFIIEGTINKSAPIDENIMNEHIAYSTTAANAGLILVSGLKSDESGGLSIMKAESLEKVEAYLSADPLKVSGIQDYRVMELTPHFVQPIANEWFGR
ncbi:YciI family protein [Clostridium paraputrificum]|uniref:YciI family protein n=1 Tax=Clostridium paraputrificum TaxID=29363 RepID=UPI003D352A86